MLTEIVLFLLLSTGSVVCAAVGNRRYEEALPLTSSFIVICLFLFGLCGALAQGVLVTCILCLLAYLFALVWIVRKRRFQAFLRQLFSPGLCIFIGLFCFLIYLNHGRMVSGWDEFSHWADSVKVMTCTDDFITNAQSGSFFQSYPPGVALLQYFAQKVMVLLRGGGLSEWRIYLYYQVFMLSFCMPFTRKLTFREPTNIVLSAVAIFAAPLLFYPELYTGLLIDPFLCVVSGAGLALLFVMPRDRFRSIMLLTIATILVLAKDAGLFLACTLVVGLVLDDALYRRGKQKRGLMSYGYTALLCLAGLCAVLVPKLLWNLNIRINHAKKAFALAIDWRTCINVLLRRDTTWRMDVFDGYWRTLFTRGITLGNTGLTLPYIVLLPLLACALWATSRLLARQEVADRVSRKAFVWLPIIQSGLVLIGLCILYLFQFSSYEALLLSRLDERYIAYAFLPVWMMIVLSAVSALPKVCGQGNALTAALLCGMAITIPWGTTIPGLLWRDAVPASIVMRAPYEEMAEIVRNAIGDRPARIYFISQGTTGLDSYVMHYVLRPYDSPSKNPYREEGDVDNTAYLWSVGEPFYEGDIWKLSITVDEWRQHLAEDFDYVVLYKLNDYFYSHFASAFTCPEDIAEKTVYQVDSETGLLTKCS